jgi:hypothetical protein
MEDENSCDMNHSFPFEHVWVQVRDEDGAPVVICRCCNVEN